MSGRSVLVGSIVIVLLAGGVAGGCGSSDDTSKKPQGLCGKIGTDALRKVLPNFEPDPPGEGESAACVRLNEGQSGGFLRITIENPSPGTDQDCGNLQKDTSEGAIYMAPEQLVGVGDYACGSVAAEDGGGIVVTVLSRRGPTNVSIVHGRASGDVATVRESVVELARTVMRQV
jgi:hypothetical protein